MSLRSVGAGLGRRRLAARCSSRLAAEGCWLAVGAVLQGATLAAQLLAPGVDLRLERELADWGGQNPCNAVYQERPMEVALKKMGNSTALVIPPQVLKALGIGAGHHLKLDTTPDGKIVLTPKRKHVLAEMIAQCDLKAAPPADLALWDVARPVGGEVI